MYSALFTLNTTTEVPLSKAPNPQLLPGRHSINGCSLLQVCVHGVCVFTVCVCTLDGLNAEHQFRVWVTILGRMSRHFHITFTKGVVKNLSCPVNFCQKNPFILIRFIWIRNTRCWKFHMKAKNCPTQISQTGSTGVALWSTVPTVVN